jgi:hypothetical protein
LTKGDYNEEDDPDRLAKRSPRLAEHHHARKMVRAPVSEQFRNANNAVAQPSTYSDYTDGHALSAYWQLF